MKNQAQTTGASADSFKMLRSMVGIGLICALLIVVTFQGTLPRIEQLKAEALEQAIFKVIPGMTTKQTFQLTADGNFKPVGPEVKDGELVYAGYDDKGQLLGIAVPASGMGFADVLKVLYGYNPDKQTTVGFYVLESKETPGLGDKIEKDAAFLSNFETLDLSLNQDQSSLQNEVIAVKHGQKKNAWEVDGITGATISSRAIGNLMNASAARWAPLIYKNKPAFAPATTEKPQQ